LLQSSTLFFSRLNSYFLVCCHHQFFLKITMMSLMTGKAEFDSMNEEKSRKLSITLTLFTGMFLVCNIPAFLLQVINLCRYIKDLENISRGPFVEWYGHLTYHFFL
jgi:hypothetical protein